MSRFTASMPASYFEELYASDADPWRFAASPYEAEKYAATLAALPRPRYASALEVGCSIGVLTRRLAERCAALHSLDVAEAALDQARARCADLPHVRFSRRRVPGEWPEARYDLVLLSEVVYYLDRADVARLAARVGASLVPGGDVVLVHWLGATNYSLGGDEAAECFTAASAGYARPRRSDRTEHYRLDVLRAPGAEDT